MHITVLHLWCRHIFKEFLFIYFDITLFTLLIMMPSFILHMIFCLCSFVGNRGLCGKQISAVCKNGGTGIGPSSSSGNITLQCDHLFDSDVRVMHLNSIFRFIFYLK